MDTLNKILDLSGSQMLALVVLALVVLLIIALIRHKELQKLFDTLQKHEDNTPSDLKVTFTDDQKKELYKLEAYISGMTLTLDFPEVVRIAPDESLYNYFIYKVTYLKAHSVSLKKLILDFADSKTFNSHTIVEITRLVKYVNDNNGIELEMIFKSGAKSQSVRQAVDLYKKTNKDLPVKVTIKK